MFPGVGTAVNVATVLVGAAIGVAVGHRLPQRTRDVVTDGLGLVTMLIAATTAWSVLDPDLASAVGGAAPMLIVLGAVLIGGIVGSLLRIETRLESFGGWLQVRLTGAGDATERRRFIEGFVSTSLLFCTGPLTVLGSLSDGLGTGADQLFLKSALDGFAAVAFAASFGWGVAASAVTVAVVQGGLTVIGLALGSTMPQPELIALTATGGLLLVGVALRLLRIRDIPVGDLMPALVVAPLLVAATIAVRS